MVSTPSELGVERSLFSWLDGLGWETHGQDGGRGAIVLDEAYDRQTNEVVYWMLLEEQVLALNDDVTEENVEKFLSSLKRDLDAENLMDGNRAFHRLLTKGKAFNVQRDNGSIEAVYVDLIDYENPENNRFHAVNQFSVSRGTTIRPDVTLFVNGIPLVTMELKSVTQDNYYVDAIRDPTTTRSRSLGCSSLACLTSPPTRWNFGTARLALPPSSTSRGTTRRRRSAERGDQTLIRIAPDRTSNEPLQEGGQKVRGDQADVPRRRRGVRLSGLRGGRRR